MYSIYHHPTICNIQTQDQSNTSTSQPLLRNANIVMYNVTVECGGLDPCQWPVCTIGISPPNVEVESHTNGVACNKNIVARIFGIKQTSLCGKQWRQIATVSVAGAGEGHTTQNRTTTRIRKRTPRKPRWPLQRNDKLWIRYTDSQISNPAC